MISFPPPPLPSIVSLMMSSPVAGEEEHVRNTDAASIESFSDGRGMGEADGFWGVKKFVDLALELMESKWLGIKSNEEFAWRLGCRELTFGSCEAVAVVKSSAFVD